MVLKTWGSVAAFFLLVGLVLLANPTSAQEDPYTQASPPTGPAQVQGERFERPQPQEADVRGARIERGLPITGLDVLQIAGLAVVLIAAGMVLRRRRRHPARSGATEAP